MLGQRAAGAPALLSTGALQRRIGLFLLGLGFGHGLFEILQREIELVGIEPLRAPTELQALKLADQMAETVILGGELIALGDKAYLLSTLGVPFGPGLREHRVQHGDVAGRGLGGRVHAPI
jgi:hypothetical protein